jgi:hypothetical protein
MVVQWLRHRVLFSIPKYFEIANIPYKKWFVILHKVEIGKIFKWVFNFWKDTVYEILEKNSTLNIKDS